jgi:predicted transcriptional regulator
MDEARMREIEEKFADAVVAVPADEPLLEGLVKRAKTEGLRRIVERHAPGNDLYDAVVAELARRDAS